MTTVTLPRPRTEALNVRRVALGERIVRVVIRPEDLSEAERLLAQFSGDPIASGEYAERLLADLPRQTERWMAVDPQLAYPKARTAFAVDQAARRQRYRLAIAARYWRDPLDAKAYVESLVGAAAEAEMVADLAEGSQSAKRLATTAEAARGLADAAESVLTELERSAR